MSALSTVRESLSRALARPFSYVSGEWERLAPRERRWVTALAAATVGAVVLLCVYFVFSSVADLEAGNADIREALAAIAKHHDEYLEAKAKSATQEARIGTEPPQLTTDLEAAAHEETLQISESSERPPSPAGRRYIERDVDLKIREVDLQTLTKFMRRVETGPRLIFFTRLSLKRRYSETDKLDVEATATAFERVRDDKLRKKPDAAKDGTKDGSKKE
jgi:type II secretory pathway component PulM